MLKRLVLVVSLVLSWSLIGGAAALADKDDPDESGEQVVSRGNSVYGKAWRKERSTQGSERAESHSGAGDGNGASGGSGSPSGSADNSPSDAEVRRQAEERERMVRAYEAAFRRFEACMAAQGASCRPPAPMNTDASFTAAQPAAGGAAGAPVVTVTPQAAAQMAMAKLTLTPPTPGIGPPPKINEWKMAAVGYPLWLWGEGNLDPGPVSDAVAGLSVRLDPRLDKIVFSMGDGESVTCQNAGTEWTPAVEPGTESPTCGYRYQRPSLPKGNYTVTARTHWEVSWSINGVTGSIPMVQEAATELPVGELQALVR